MRAPARLVLLAGAAGLAWLAFAQARQVSQAGQVGQAGPASSAESWAEVDPFAGYYAEPWGAAAELTAWQLGAAEPVGLEPPGAIVADAEGGEEGVLDAYVLPVAYGALELFSFGGAMRLSPQGLASLKQLEGLSLEPYPDAMGYSIGYGHLLRPGEWYARITEREAEALLAQDVRSAERTVNALVRAPITQGMFDSLVSFAYNVGGGAFRASTLLRLLNARDYAGAQAQFARWRFTTRRGLKMESAALVSRREHEAALFASQGFPAGSTTA